MRIISIFSGKSTYYEGTWILLHTNGYLFIQELRDTVAAMSLFYDNQMIQHCAGARK
jgi:hypothetical protein